MRNSEDRPDEVPDEVPVADAVEQQRPAVAPPVDEEVVEEDIDDTAANPPLETPEPDWQEQHVVEETDLDETDRREE